LHPLLLLLTKELICYQGSGLNLGNRELASDVDLYEKVNHHANS